MPLKAVLLGVLLTAGSLFPQAPRPMTDPQVRNGAFVWFDLTENKTQVARALGPPAMAADAGEDYVSWQYQIGVADHDDFSHVLVFRKSTGELISITRNYDPERSVAELFPESETKTYFNPDAVKPIFRLRMRRLTGGRVLLAMGISEADQPTGALVLIRESELRTIVPWLHQQLQKAR